MNDRCGYMGERDGGGVRCNYCCGNVVELIRNEVSQLPLLLEVLMMRYLSNGVVAAFDHQCDVESGESAV